MERCIRESCRGRICNAGGIVSLAKAINEHREAFEYDLLTNTGYQLSDIGAGLDWNAVRTFMRHLTADSAVGQELHPEYAEWATRTKTNAILADIFDMLATINANIVAIGSRKTTKQPKPYPRPNQKKPENVQHFGRDALPPDELHTWFEKKRKEKCQ